MRITVRMNIRGNIIITFYFHSVRNCNVFVRRRVGLSIYVIVMEGWFKYVRNCNCNVFVRRKVGLSM